ncbi:MAG: nucleotidyltransferase family protein [Alphaproteobacteria bacterium]|nr:nucleotidyltransferase family protein [Alphaproteobacteria bacterium]
MTSSGPPPPDAEALWELARATAGGPPARADGLDPEAIARILRRHRLVSHSASLDLWSDDQRDVLLPLWRAAAGRSMAHAVTQARVLALLREAGVRSTPLKGVAFQLAMTGSPVGRDHRDLDLWAPDVRRATEVLRDHGWRGDLDGPLPSEVSLADDQGLTLDLHGSLFARRYALDRVDGALADLLDEGGDLHVDGHAFLACLHGAKDGWSTLRHLADLRLGLQRADHDVLRDLSRATRTRRALDVGAALADRLAGSTAWAPATDVSGLLPGLEAALRGPIEERPTFARTWLYLRSRESWRDRARAIVRVPGQVSAADEPGPGRIVRRAFRLFRTYARLSRPLGG